MEQISKAEHQILERLVMDRLESMVEIKFLRLRNVVYGIYVVTSKEAIT